MTNPDGVVSGRRVLIGITGGIAAYKLCEVISTLAKAGADVRVVMTSTAEEFITPLTIATLSRRAAYTDQSFWQPTHGRPLHIELGEWADVLIIAPLSANTLAKLAQGIADNLLTNVVLASTCPVLLVPAMNNVMWQQASVQRNWQLLLADSRYHGIAPEPGVLACTPVDAPVPKTPGRMAEPATILAYITSLLYTVGRRDLLGKRLLISAGGTREHLDPVRFLGNPASGKMGVALAQAAAHRGAIVILVHAPLLMPYPCLPESVQMVPVLTAEEMRHALLEHVLNVDWVLMAAAVADVKPATYSATKLAKADLPEQLPLVPVPDIVAELAMLKQPHQCLVGFAAQTGDVVTPAKDKLLRKGLDVIVANPIDQADSGFGSDRNQAIVLDKTGRQIAIAPCTKLELAHQIIDIVQTLQLSP
ncbi:MAG: bifunctional phosphopantothenoylcysteine decarboxylase/phosphopantothenate--cysteine ligase CoaBC [Cyanobacteria bacterium]|nr:bifunctional phosphopantothenoylcysteine decarboxylase/phosphopantothenate--cysteine ligase CoaBC [Cyanobacteriota bacterium]MDW8199664.1 bifunctional phosphopantothenoylcysteine decarboxylase/phosphopantothenate--cysteine ligase CoaBC [Cyanobacteriota bacterium SKYGB_h_bin112]